MSFKSLSRQQKQRALSLTCVVYRSFLDKLNAATSLFKSLWYIYISLRKCHDWYSRIRQHNDSAFNALYLKLHIFASYLHYPWCKCWMESNDIMSCCCVGAVQEALHMMECVFIKQQWTCLDPSVIGSEICGCSVTFNPFTGVYNTYCIVSAEKWYP